MFMIYDMIPVNEGMKMIQRRFGMVRKFTLCAPGVETGSYNSTISIETFLGKFTNI